MAEQQEIKYIPYGLDEISQLDLMTSLANGIDSYLGSKKWARKDKYRNAWLAAYLDIINRGLLGASNESGVWKINHEGDEIPMNEKSNIEREMYGDAAYYIRLLMSRITPRKKEEEDKKKNLDKFDFYNTFHEKFMEPYFGKDELFSDPELGWNALDKRQNNGLRLTTNRRLAMLKVLRDYLKDLDSKEYNFEESGFKDKEDVRTKIQAAIKALDTESEEDDFPAFNALGLKYRSYFSNGGNEINPTTGVSYEQEAQQLQQKLDEEAKVKAALEAKLTLANRGVLTYSTNNNAIDAIHNAQGYLNWILQKYSPQNGGVTAFNNRLLELLEKSYNQGKGNGLSPQERKELGNMIHYVRTNNPKYLQYNLTSEDEGYLNTQDFKGLQGKRLNDFVRLPFLTSDGRYTYADKSGNIYFLKPKNQAKLTTAPTFNKNKMLEYNNYIKGFGKNQEQIHKEQAAINMNTPLSLMTEWTPEMKKEIEAIAWDAASILNPEAFSGSAMALYASHLRDEANPNRGTLEKWLDYGTGALGGILGFGDLLVTGKLGYRLYQLGKSIGSVSKFAGILGAGFGAIGAFEARDSIAKIANPDSLTPQDLENIAYGLMGLIGLKSFAKARNKQTIGKSSNPTVTEQSIHIKDKSGQVHEIKIDAETAKQVNESYGYTKKNSKADAEVLDIPKIRENVLKYNEANPTKKLDLEGASIEHSNKTFGKVKDAVKSKNVPDPNAPKYEPIGTRYWFNPGYMYQGNNKWGYYLGGGWQRKAWENVAPEHSSKGLWLRAKEFWSPEPKPIETPKSSTEIPKTSETPVQLQQTQSTFVPHSRNEIRKDWKNTIEKGQFSNNKITTGNYKVGNFNILVSKTTDGKYRIHTDVYSSDVHGPRPESPTMKPLLQKFENQKELLKEIAKIVKESRRRANLSDVNGKRAGINHKEIGKILLELKRKGWLKQGGTINNNLDITIENFFKNNNI